MTNLPETLKMPVRKKTLPWAGTNLRRPSREFLPFEQRWHKDRVMNS
jgi:hypothetical protein